MKGFEMFSKDTKALEQGRELNTVWEVCRGSKK
jgi:hypothetical protein